MKRVLGYVAIVLAAPVSLVILYFRFAYGLVDVIFQAIEEDREKEASQELLEEL